MRRAFQTSMEERFTDVVEQTTGRKVVAYMSQVHCDPDIAVEIFVLQPGETPFRDEHEEELDGN